MKPMEITVNSSITTNKTLPFFTCNKVATTITAIAVLAIMALVAYTNRPTSNLRAKVTPQPNTDWALRELCQKTYKEYSELYGYTPKNQLDVTVENNLLCNVQNPDAYFYGIAANQDSKYCTTFDGIQKNLNDADQQNLISIGKKSKEREYDESTLYTDICFNIILP